MQKYQVIEMNCESLDCKILFTAEDLPSALEYTELHLKNGFKFDDSLKCYKDNESYCIYEYYYIFPKKLVNKVMIREYIEYEKD